VPHHRGADEWLEPDEGRFSCPVLGGRRRSNALLLPDQVHGVDERGQTCMRKKLRRAQVALPLDRAARELQIDAKIRAIHAPRVLLRPHALWK